MFILHNGGTSKARLRLASRVRACGAEVLESVLLLGEELHQQINPIEAGGERVEGSGKTTMVDFSALLDRLNLGLHSQQRSEVTE